MFYKLVFYSFRKCSYAWASPCSLATRDSLNNWLRLPPSLGRFFLLLDQSMIGCGSAQSKTSFRSALTAPSVRTSAIQTSLMALGLSSVETVFELSRSRFLSCEHAQGLCKVRAERNLFSTMPSRSQSSVKPQRAM